MNITLSVADLSHYFSCPSQTAKALVAVAVRGVAWDVMASGGSLANPIAKAIIIVA